MLKKKNWFLGSITGIGAGMGAWYLSIIISNYFPPYLDEPSFFLSFPLSAFIGNSSRIAIITGILTVPIDIFIAILLFAMAGGGMR